MKEMLADFLKFLYLISQTIQAGVLWKLWELSRRTRTGKLFEAAGKYEETLDEQDLAQPSIEK